MKVDGNQAVLTCDELISIRESLRMTRKEMARFCGINPRTYHHWETKKVNPNVSRFILLLTYTDALVAMHRVAEENDWLVERYNSDLTDQESCCYDHG